MAERAAQQPYQVRTTGEYGRPKSGTPAPAARLPENRRGSPSSASVDLKWRITQTAEQAKADLEAVRLIAAKDQPNSLAAAQKALVDLARAYSGHLEQFVGKILQRRQQMYVQDIVQETWERVWTRPGSYLDKLDQRAKPVVSWIFRIAKNLSIDRLRRSKPELLVIDHVDHSDEVYSESPAIREGALALWRDHERDVAIADSADAVLASLPPQRRQVLVLIHFHELSSMEAAALLDRTESSIRSTVHVTRRHARQVLAEMGIVSLRDLVESD